MADLARVGRNAMATQQDRDGNEPGFVAALRVRCSQLGDSASAAWIAISSSCAETRRASGVSAGHRQELSRPSSQSAALIGRAAWRIRPRPGEARAQRLGRGCRQCMECAICAKLCDPAAIKPPSQIASNSARVISAGCDEAGCITSATWSSILPRSRNPPSRSDAIPGSWILARRVQCHCPRTDFDPEFARATKHRADADLIAPATIAELIGLSVHAMKAQEQSQVLEAPDLRRGHSHSGLPFLYSTFRNAATGRVCFLHAFPKTGNSTVAHRQGTRHTACSQPKRRKQLSKH